jgi:mannose-6-phosphate isomerase-like protein (cupin superfamily)
VGNYEKVSVSGVDAERSTCGFRQRLLKKDDGAPASITFLRTDSARPHWHKRTHEYYYVLKGVGKIVIDGEDVPVQGGDCVWIKPGAVHHAEGNLESLIIGIPPFDTDDLFFETPEETEA